MSVPTCLWYWNIYWLLLWNKIPTTKLFGQKWILFIFQTETFEIMNIRTIPASYKGDFIWDETNFCIGQNPTRIWQFDKINSHSNERSECWMLLSASNCQIQVGFLPKKNSSSPNQNHLHNSLGSVLVTLWHFFSHYKTYSKKLGF